MRLFCELFLVAALIWLGWTKSFRDRFDQMRGVEPASAAQQAQVRQTTAAATTTTAPAPAPAPRQPFLPASRVRPPTASSGDWMWDPAHRNPLDRPAFKTGGAGAQETPNQNYWIDGRGVRHYGNTPPPATSP